MKAAVLTAYGDVDKFELRDVPDVHAAPGAICVRMRGAGINPIDWKMRSGAAKARFPVDFPAILGRDVGGEVVEVGPGVTAFTIGDRVLGFTWKAYAELVTGPVEAWAKMPDRLDVAEAGALPLVLLTGAQIIEDAIQPSSGAVVLVTGALGSVGRVAVHAARARGAKVWAGVRASKRAQAEELGVDGVVALDDDSDIAKLPTLDAIADTVSGETIHKLFGKLRAGGVIGSVLGEPAGARERGLVVRAFMTRPNATMLARYAAAVAEGKLSVPIAKKLPLASVAEAHRLAESGRAGGKVLLLG